MTIYQGFSLTEVLVALLLVTTTSLTLLHQQWQASQFFNQALLRSLALVQLDNNSERIVAEQPLAKVEKPFCCQKAEMSFSVVMLQIGWNLAPVTESGCCQLQRYVALIL
jgi:prepilin-type N-terminal cleavage/methylation domain-containing protein